MAANLRNDVLGISAKVNIDVAFTFDYCIVTVAIILALKRVCLVSEPIHASEYLL